MQLKDRSVRASQMLKTPNHGSRFNRCVDRIACLGYTLRSPSCSAMQDGFLSRHHKAMEELASFLMKA